MRFFSTVGRHSPRAFLNLSAVDHSPDQQDCSSAVKEQEKKPVFVITSLKIGRRFYLLLSAKPLDFLPTTTRTVRFWSDLDSDHDLACWRTGRLKLGKFHILGALRRALGTQFGRHKTGTLLGDEVS